MRVGRVRAGLGQGHGWRRGWVSAPRQLGHGPDELDAAAEVVRDRHEHLVHVLAQLLRARWLAGGRRCGEAGGWRHGRAAWAGGRRGAARRRRRWCREARALASGGWAPRRGVARARRVAGAGRAARRQRTISPCRNVSRCFLVLSGPRARQMTRMRETAWSCLCGSPVLSSEQKKSNGRSDLATRAVACRRRGRPAPGRPPQRGAGRWVAAEPERAA